MLQLALAVGDEAFHSGAKRSIARNSPERNSPDSDYNRDSESDTRAHSPEEQLKRTIAPAI